MKTSPSEPKKGKSFARTTISLPLEVFSAGKERAGADRRDFSNYIAVLIARDAQKPELAVE